MKNRKPNETDAAYIARLETANAGLRQNNKMLSDQNVVFSSRGRQAAGYAGAVLNAAAEACGLQDDQRTHDAAVCLQALSGLPWSKDIPVPSLLPDFSKANPGENGGDAEMVIASMFEEVAGAMDPWTVHSLLSGLPEKKREIVSGILWTLYRKATENLSAQARAATGVAPRPKFDPPEITTLEEAREVIYDLWMEIGNTLSDVGTSQSILRLDLRAGMYATAFREIGDAINAAERRARDLPMSPAAPWGSASIPF